MGLRDRREQVIAEKAGRQERDADPGQRWEYKALNLKKVPGMALETTFSELGDLGWELVANIDGYAVFKRPA